MPYAVVNATASGSNEILPSIGGRSYRVLSYTIIAATAVVVTWKSGSTAISGPMALTDNGGAAVPNTGSGVGGVQMGVFETARGAALNLDLSAAVVVGGHLTYQIIG